MLNIAIGILYCLGTMTKRRRNLYMLILLKYILFNIFSPQPADVWIQYPRTQRIKCVCLLKCPVSITLGEEKSVKKTTPAQIYPILQSRESLYLGQVQGPPPWACSPGSVVSKILTPGAGSKSTSDERDPGQQWSRFLAILSGGRRAPSMAWAVCEL